MSLGDVGELAKGMAGNAAIPQIIGSFTPINGHDQSEEDRLLLYFAFSKLVWLATQTQWPPSKTQVSVKRPRCS